MVNHSSSPSSDNVTMLLKAWSAGDRSALDQLVPLIYQELRRLAGRFMSREQHGHTLETGALLNEAYLRLINWNAPQSESRGDFYRVAAQIMRRVLVDHARRRSKDKRNRVRPASLENVATVSANDNPDYVALDEALSRLAEMNPRMTMVVEFRFFAGLSVEETAAILNVSPFTVLRDWRLAKAWLRRELRDMTSV